MRRAALTLGVLLLAIASTGCAAGVDSDLNALDTAQGVAGQTLLREAAPVAGNYFSTNGTYEGFNAAAAAAEEPSLHWVDGGTPQPNKVTIVGADATSVVLLTAETAGEVWCLGQSAGVDSMGMSAASSAATCTGGW